MTALEKLHQEAFNQDIDVVYLHVCKKKKSMCLSEDEYKEIIIDKKALKSSVEEMVLLAEEMSHFETGTLYHIQADFNAPLQRLNRNKAEYQARNKEITSCCQNKRLLAQGYC